jgi:hypothetical protein
MYLKLTALVYCAPSLAEMDSSVGTLEAVMAGE